MAAGLGGLCIVSQGVTLLVGIHPGSTLAMLVQSQWMIEVVLLRVFLILICREHVLQIIVTMFPTRVVDVVAVVGSDEVVQIDFVDVIILRLRQLQL